MADGKIIYKVLVDTDDVERDVTEAGHRAGGKFEEVMTGAARRVGEAFVNMAAKAVQGIEQIVKAGVDFNAKMETYETAFTTLLGSAEEAQKVMSQIRQDAASTPFDVDSLTQANQMLISAGVSAKDSRKDILNLANAIAATGGGSAELSRMAANMQQIKNVGKATAMDIRQFANAGINIYGLLADAMGVTVEQASEMDVSYEMLTAAFEKAAAAGGKYEDALLHQSQTFEGRMSTLKDNITQLEGALTADLFNQLSNTAMPMVMDWVATLLEAAQTGGIEGAIDAARDIIKNLVNNILAQAPTMINTGIDMLLSFVNGLSKSLPTLINKGVELISKLVSTIWDRRGDILNAGVELVTSLATGLLNTIPTLINAALQLATNLLDTLRTTDWWSVGSHIVQGIHQGFVAWWDSLVAQVQEAMNNLFESVKAFFGIHSPSTKFAWIAEMNVKGMEEGFTDSEAELTRTVHTVFDKIPDAAMDAISSADLERNVSYNLTATGGMTQQIVVPLFLDGREIARATAWSMGEQLAWEEM